MFGNSGSEYGFLGGIQFLFALFSTGVGKRERANRDSTRDDLLSS